MSFFSGFKEKVDTNEENGGKAPEISEYAQDKFDKLMGDNKLQDAGPRGTELSREGAGLSGDEKFDDLFKGSTVTNDAANHTDCSADAHEDHQETDSPREPNLKYEVDGDVYETDAEGNPYKKNGELLPDTEYTANGNKYKTDENGNIVSCNSEPKYTEEGGRNLKEQRESGGEGRREDDDGGHIIARILGGSEGAENLVPMRRTINRGDYKKMENEISQALKDGNKVLIHVDLEYNGDSHRPSIIKATYNIDGRKTEAVFDNDENSTDLGNSLEGEISAEDYENLMEELQDMEADGHSASITSVKTEYKENGDPTKITVGVLDEATGTKTYKVYQPKGDE